MSTVNNPTCPHCQAPMQVIAAALLSGGLAILLECEYWHQSVVWKPTSRFGPRLDAKGYNELIEEEEEAWRKVLAILPQYDNLTQVFRTVEFVDFKRIFDIANEYYACWQGIE